MGTAKAFPLRSVADDSFVTEPIEPARFACQTDEDRLSGKDLKRIRKKEMTNTTIKAIGDLEKTFPPSSSSRLSCVFATRTQHTPPVALGEMKR